ncbi:alpha-(1-_6)-mannopyranosyltransferase A, partial [Mycobacterium tuberculosis]
MTTPSHAPAVDLATAKDAVVQHLSRLFEFTTGPQGGP